MEMPKLRHRSTQPIMPESLSTSPSRNTSAPREVRSEGTFIWDRSLGGASQVAQGPTQGLNSALRGEASYCCSCLSVPGIDHWSSFDEIDCCFPLAGNGQLG